MSLFMDEIIKRPSQLFFILKKRGPKIDFHFKNMKILQGTSIIPCSAPWILKKIVFFDNVFDNLSLLKFFLPL
jgi:hypothetical protein